MWAQGLVEYGALSGAVAAVQSTWYRIDSALGNNGGIVVIVVAVVLLFWSLRR